MGAGKKWTEGGRAEREFIRETDGRKERCIEVEIVGGNIDNTVGDGKDRNHTSLHNAEKRQPKIDRERERRIAGMKGLVSASVVASRLAGAGPFHRI